jgi:hypothetical protein
MRNESYDAPLHQLRLDRASAAGRLDAFYRMHLVDDDALRRGLVAGTLAVDTRLRDALRTLQHGAGSFDTPGSGASGRLSFPTPNVPEVAAFAAEVSTLAEIDALVRAERRVDLLEDRLGVLERGRFPRALVVRASRLTHRRRLAPR